MKERYDKDLDDFLYDPDDEDDDRDVEAFIKSSNFGRKKRRGTPRRSGKDKD
jgi:hypothetical protein